MRPALWRHLRELPSTMLILLVTMYQAILSPILGGRCRFVPSCSNYFIESVRRHGAIVGGIQGLWRIVRCNPFCKGGYDPVK